MEQNYKTPVNRSIYYVLLLFFMMVGSVFAQTETEPNNEANQAGTQRVVWSSPTTITGTVSNADPDYWNISKLPGIDPQNVIELFISSGYDPATIQVEYELRTGGYNGNVASSFRAPRLLNQATANFYNGIGYPSVEAGWYGMSNISLGTTDNYMVLKITTTSSTPIPYSIVLESEDFPTCTTPADVTGLNVTTTGGDNLQFDAFSAVSGITGGYVVEISDSPTFNPLPNPQFDALTGTTPSTVYSGSGQQVIYASPKPNRLATGFEVPTVPGNILVTDLSPNITYYFRVTTANECNGYFSFSNGATISGATFACDPALIAPNQVSNIVTVNNTIDSFGITSFTAPTGGANGYVIKVNTTNSFTAPTDADLTSASTIYNSGAGEQVVYAGTSVNPNITINGTGITAGTNFFVKIYAYNTCLGGNFFENTGTTGTRTICNGAPTVVPSALSIDQISHSSMRVNSTSGAGGAIGQVILINTVDSFTPPVPGTLPAVNAAYSGTGQQVIYAGSAVNPALTVTNLTNANGGTQYFFKSYAYNPCGTNFYFEAIGVKANATTCGAVQNVASNAIFFEVGDSFMDFKSFSPATGVTGYVVKMNTVNTFSPPTDGSNTLPTSNPNYTGGEQIVYAGTSTNPDIRITGLSAATTYYFTIYSYTDCSGALFYEQTGYSFSRQNVNSPSNLTFNDFSVTFGAAAFDLNNLTSSLSPGARSYTIMPGGTSTGGSALSGTGNNIMTAGNVGTVLVRVDQEAAANFNSGTEQATITINKANPTITFNNQTVPFGSSAVTLGAISNSTGTISYSFVGSANGNVLSGTNNEILTPGNAGTVTVRATVAADANFNEATKDIFFSVSAPSEIISINANGVYKVVNESTMSTLVNFTANTTATGSDGKGELLQVNGKLWGVTNAGGANGKGTIFNLNTDGTGFTKVHDFNATTEGSDPSGFLTFSNGKIWGVLSTGGPGSGSGSAGGSIFSINTDGTNFTVVRGFSFTDFTLSELAAPIGGLTEANGKLWGVTQFGGHTFAGGVYSINSDGTGYTEAYLFPSSGLPGQPRAKLTLANNKLWGTASSNGGGIFTIDPTTITQAGTGYSLVHRFGFSGGESLSTLTTVGNQLFGIWREGGANSAGVLFRINDNGTNYGTLHDWPFSGGARLPFSSLTIDGGTLFGSTTTGGTNNLGTLYKIKTDGTGYQEILANTVTPSEGAFIIVKDRLMPTINFNNQTVEHLSVTTLGATTNSTSPITYSLIGDITGSTLNGNKFKAGSVGTVTIRASIVADENFEAATKDVTITINRTNPIFTIADINTTFGSADITLAPSTTNYTGGTITYQFVDPTNTNNLATTGFNTSSTISSTTLRLGTPGAETIRITLPANVNFNTRTVDINLTIDAATADLSQFVDITKTTINPNFNLPVTAPDGASISYAFTSNNSGSIISGNTITIGGIGDVTDVIRVTVTQENYHPTTKDFNLVVNKSQVNLSYNGQVIFNGGLIPASYFSATATDANNNPVQGVLVYTYGGQTVTSGSYFHIVANNIVSNPIYHNQAGVSFRPTDPAKYTTPTALARDIRVEALPVTITLNNISKAVGATDPALTYTHTDLPTFRNFKINVPLKRVAGETAGIYTISVDMTKPTLDANGGTVCSSGICIYEETNGNGVDRTGMFVEGSSSSIQQGILSRLTSQTASFVIENKTPITASDITFTAPANLTYDGTLKSYTATPNVSLSPALPAGDIDVTYEGRNGTVYAISATPPTNAGDYRVLATVNSSNGDYTGSVNTNFSIIKRVVEVTADGKTKLYGDTDPALTYQITTGNLVGSDAFTGSLTRVSGESVGAYAINQGSLALNSNYTLTYVSNNLTIGKRVIEITADAKTKVYGETDPTLTYQITSGSLVGGDTFTGNLTRVSGET
ncbi:MBG domain-containing protein, partial [uncultured Tenacibaculum sp.]|uniref:MBG domain-containing protein n=1 Tax=uncultured Tenacibaculum sp. TaxID=174713 RepID=UPI0026175710